jgi:small-conductance mechanosensitive channel
VAVSGAITVVSGLGVLALIGIWGLLEPLGAAYRELGLASLGGELVLAAVLLGAAYSLTGFVGRLIEEFAGTRARISEHQREIIYRLTQATLYTVVGLTIVTLFTDDIGSLLVGAGFLGIVVGMAARQTLGAMLAGFVLMFSRPFEIGDWVEIGDNEGIVTQITIVNTRIQTFDGEHVMLPNDEVSSQPIVNRTRKGRLRVEVEVGVDYGVRPKRAAEVAVEAVDGLDAVSTVPTPQVVVKRFDDSAVVLGVRTWIDDPSARRMWRAKTAVVDAVHEAFDREGIEIPFPQRTLSQREGEVLAEGEGVEVAAADGGGDEP